MKQYTSSKETIEKNLDSENIVHDDILEENLNDQDEKEVSEISQIIDKLDIQEEEKQKINSYIRKEVFRGPLPHPNILKQYEDIQPGFASQIIQMTLDEQKHRHKIESFIVETELTLNKEQFVIQKESLKLNSRLQIFGFIITVLLVAVGIVCIF